MSTKERKRRSSSTSIYEHKTDEEFNALAVASFQELCKTFPCTKFEKHTSDFFFHWNLRKLSKGGDVDRMSADVLQKAYDCINQNKNLRDDVSAKCPYQDQHSVVESCASKIKKMLRNCLHQQESRKRSKSKALEADKLTQDRCQQAKVAMLLMIGGVNEEGRVAFEEYKRREKQRLSWVE